MAVNSVSVTEGYECPQREGCEVHIALDPNGILCISDDRGEIDIGMDDLVTALRCFGYSCRKEVGDGESAT
jgi:hypothetical protein